MTAETGCADWAAGLSPGSIRDNPAVPTGGVSGNFTYDLEEFRVGYIPPSVTTAVEAPLLDVGFRVLGPRHTACMCSHMCSTKPAIACAPDRPCRKVIRLGSQVICNAGDTSCTVSIVTSPVSNTTTSGRRLRESTQLCSCSRPNLTSCNPRRPQYACQEDTLLTAEVAPAASRDIAGRSELTDGGSFGVVRSSRKPCPEGVHPRHLPACCSSNTCNDDGSDNSSGCFPASAEAVMAAQQLPSAAWTSSASATR